MDSFGAAMNTFASFMWGTPLVILLAPKVREAAADYF